MEVWLLSRLSTTALTVLIVGGTTFFAVAGSFAVRRRFPQVGRGEQNDMVSVLLGMYGAIYGIIPAFGAVAEWKNMNAAQGVVVAEATY